MIIQDFVKPRMPKRFLLVEGIDGSGKDTFVSILAERIKERYGFYEDAPLSICGQPAFRFDTQNIIRRLIENGETSGISLENMCHLLTENRFLHSREGDAAGFRGGLTICIRGLLTELATLERVYNQKLDSSLGQTDAIDCLIVVDVDPKLAWERISKRGYPIDWRETPENLCFFRDFFLKTAPSVTQAYSHIVIRNTGSIKDLNAHALCLIEDLVRKDINANG